MLFKTKDDNLELDTLQPVSIEDVAALEDIKKVVHEQLHLITPFKIDEGLYENVA